MERKRNEKEPKPNKKDRQGMSITTDKKEYLRNPVLSIFICGSEMIGNPEPQIRADKTR